MATSLRTVCISVLAFTVWCVSSVESGAQDFYGNERMRAASPERAQLREIDQRRTFIAALEKAKTGDVKAQLSVARSYELGIGTTKDTRSALEWFKKAADGGNRFAALGVASFYAAGVAVPADLNEADRWLMKYRELGGKYPCVALKDASLQSDPAVNASLCAIVHYWRQYAFLPVSRSSEPTDFNVTLGLNLANKSVVVLDGNMPLEMKARAEKSLIKTVEMVPLPKTLALSDETIPFIFRFRVEPVEKSGYRMVPLHWDN
jgi:Sel1 repeat